MAYEDVKRYFENAGLGGRVKVLDDSTATVELAAEVIGCSEGQIVKTLCFLVDDSPVLVVSAGDVKIDNKKYRGKFKQKAKMIPTELVEEYTGHSPGGVCAFGLKPGVRVYLDVKKYDVRAICDVDIFGPKTTSNGITALQ